MTVMQCRDLPEYKTTAVPPATADLPELVKPRISVVIVNYNYAEFVAAAIESVLGQVTPPWEVIVVDDGSTDESRTVIEPYRSRVNLLCQENAGQCSAYNTGLESASGDVLVFLDSDDVLHANALTEISACFLQGVAKVHFPLRLIDAAGKALPGTVPRHLDHGEVSRTLYNGAMYCSSPGSGNAYRAAVLRSLFPLPLDQSDRIGADFFLIIGCGLCGTVTAIDRPLADYRVHRLADDDPQVLTLGNSAKSGDEYRRVQQRVQRCSVWLEARSGSVLRLPDRLLDFSLEKNRYASVVLLQNSYPRRLAAGARGFPDLLKAMRTRQDFGALTRLALTGWALIVLLAPRALAFSAARYVCNPANR